MEQFTSDQMTNGSMPSNKRKAALKVMAMFGQIAQRTGRVMKLNRIMV